MHKILGPAVALAAVAVIAALEVPGIATGTAETSLVAKPKVVFIQEVTANVFSSSEWCGVKTQAAKLGFSASTTGPSTYSAQAQIPYLHAVQAQHPVGVLLGPDDDTALRQPMLQMKRAGIKLIELDTTLKDKSVSLSHISSNNVKGGQLAADRLGRLIGGKGTVLVLSLAPGVATDDQRIQGFTQEIKAKFPNIKLLPTQYDNNQVGTAESIVSATLSAHPDLTAIFGTDLTNVEGAAAGLKAAHATQVKLVGFDAGPVQIKLLKNGSVAGVVSQNPFQMGVLGVQQIYNSLHGKPVRKFIATPLSFVTKANLGSPEVAHFLYQPSC